MQIVDNGAPTQIEEIFAQPAIAGASALPLTHMSQRMLNCHPLTKLISSLRSLLTLAQLDE